MTAAHARTDRSPRAMIARHPIATYLAIAFGASWAMTPLLSVSLMFGLLALFGPTLGAVVVSWADGSTGELRRRVTGWRTAPSLVLAAFATPLAVAAAAAVVWTMAGHAAPGVGSISAIDVAIFVLVIGEEIGWRGFLMPRLRARMSLAVAGLATGLVWTLWHLPIYLAPGQGLAAFAVFAAWVVPLSLVIGVLVERAHFSILIATVMHGAANVSLPILLPGVDHTWTMLATGTVYLLLAIVLIAPSRPESRQSSVALLHTKEVAA
jgi:uncharacterized protein